MSHLWKTITILSVALLVCALSACQPAAPSPTPILASAIPSPTLPPGVGRIAFYSTTGPGGSGTSAISLINTDGSGLTHLSPGFSPYWSPDGKKFFFGLWLMNTDGTEKQQLMYMDYDRPLAWSPDGQQIAFATRKDYLGSIYVLDVKTALGGDFKGGLKQLINQAVDAYDLSWSPDGRQLLFSYSKNEKSPQELAVLDAAAVPAQRFERKWKILGEGWSPTWSPDGKKIAYQFAGIYVMDADGSNQKQLTFTGGITPVWSPDGRQIAFQSKNEGNWEIYVVNADGSNQRNLTNNPASDGFPSSLAWSPDGKQIAFVSMRDGNQEIYVMNADGSHLLRLTNNDIDDWGPVWQPQP